MNIHDIYRPLLSHFRKRRLLAFYGNFTITPATRILDVGGTAFFWNMASVLNLPAVNELTMLNVMPEDPATLPHNVRWVLGDGRRMPFEDLEFDVAFSNSVIEHLGTRYDQTAFASEVRRVARRYWVQTPDPRFFVEPHYIAPFTHWLPASLRRHVVRYFTIWGLVTRPSQEEVERRVREIRLISESEFRSMFPDAEIIVEKFAGMPKSMIAVKR